MRLFLWIRDSGTARGVMVEGVKVASINRKKLRNNSNCNGIFCCFFSKIIKVLKIMNSFERYQINMQKVDQKLIYNFQRLR